MGRSAELTVENIGKMDRDHLIETLRYLRCGFDLDFTDEYLGSISLERLRHILLAASLHARRQPNGCI